MHQQLKELRKVKSGRGFGKQAPSRLTRLGCLCDAGGPTKKMERETTKEQARVEKNFAARHKSPTLPKTMLGRHRVHCCGDRHAWGDNLHPTTFTKKTSSTNRPKEPAEDYSEADGKKKTPVQHNTPRDGQTDAPISPQIRPAKHAHQ